jgi:hypothetical protein
MSYLLGRKKTKSLKEKLLAKVGSYPLIGERASRSGSG